MPQPDQQVNPEQVNPNDSQQDLYDIFVSQGIKLASSIGKEMQGKASIELLGNALFEIVKRIESEGQKNGIQFGLDIILHGSNEILGHLINVSKVDITEDQIKAVIGMAAGQWLRNAISTGKMTIDQARNMVQQGQQSMDQFEGATR